MTTQRYDKVLAGPLARRRRDSATETPAADATHGAHAALPGAAETLCGRHVVAPMPGDTDDPIFSVIGCQVCRRRMQAEAL